MPKCITISLTICLLTPLAVSAPKPKGDEKPVLYLPTTVGDKRVFETSFRGKTSEGPEWVASVETKGGMTVVGFSREQGGPVLYQYGASKDGVFRVSAGDHTYDPPYQLLRLPAKAGETWEAEAWAGPGVPPWKWKYTTGKEEEVEVPAGKFKAVRVEAENEINRAVVRTTYWHAPGVGMVKIATRDQGGERVQALKSFTPGKR